MRRCVLCKQVYDEDEDLGSLACAVHPLPLNSCGRGERHDTGHYDCCGASASLLDQTHCEAWDPVGCHRVDHVSSGKELRALLKQPFVCVPAERAEKLRARHGDLRSDVEFVSVPSEDLFRCACYLSTPFEREVAVNLRFEHDKILEAFADKDKELDTFIPRKGPSTAKFYRADALRSEDLGFRPFYVIRRLGCRPIAERELWIRAKDPCRF